MLESLFFYAILTTFQRWIPENFERICLNWLKKLVLKSSKKIQIFEKVKKNSSEMAKVTIFFLIFSEQGS
jgi:hypothetical protein